jgi:hypothetical protein
MSIPKVDIYDDLRANFRSWEIDCDNAEDAMTLAVTLAQRHPNVSYSECERIAQEWVGYEPEIEEC